MRALPAGGHGKGPGTGREWSVAPGERARYNAANAKKKSRAILALRLVTEFPMSFLKYYFVRTHVTGGLMGFQYAMILAFYRFVRVVRMFAGSAQTGGDMNVNRPSA